MTLQTQMEALEKKLESINFIIKITYFNYEEIFHLLFKIRTGSEFKPKRGNFRGVGISQKGIVRISR